MQKLNAKQGQTLTRLARLTIAAKLDLKELDQAMQAMADDLAEPVFKERRGVFVTLKNKGLLRGCIGSLSSTKTLLAGVRENAINAAFHDPRFPALRAEELPETDIEVSILTKPQPCEYRDGADLLNKLRPGIDGVIIRQGLAGATFLPQVWQQLPRTEDFLAQLCRKAGLPAETWKNAELKVETYQVQYFAEEKQLRG